MTVYRCPGQEGRFWTPKDIFEIPCPHCGRQVEFFKDDPLRPCPGCARDVRNPRIDPGCAKWCKAAGQCLGQVAEAPPRAGSLCDRLIRGMEAVFGDDRRRIDHALKVLACAETIIAGRSDVSGLVVRAAAILHDIGIVEAERKHGSASGRHQEIEGPPIARRILEAMEIDLDVIDHVCKIVANHHSARDIDTPEFRVIWDADRLVNIPDEFDTSDAERMVDLVETVFKTERGKEIAKTLFLERKQS